MADFAICWDASFRGAARSAGGAVGTSEVVGKWRSSNFKKGRKRDRRTAHVGPSAFRLTRDGKVFWGLSADVSVMKGRI